jgi:hypothetical protein
MPTPGYVQGHTQPGGDRLQAPTARELREKIAEEEKKKRKQQAREFADKLIREQMEKAKATPGAQSSKITIDVDSGEATIIETSRSTRSGVSQRQYTTEYENPQLNQEFGNQGRIGDILRKEQARKDAEFQAAKTIPQKADVIQRQTTRQVIDYEAAKQFMRDYVPMSVREKVAQDLEQNAQRVGPRASITKGGQIVESGPVHYSVELEDRLSGGPYHYFVDIGKAKGPIPEPTPNDFGAGLFASFYNLYEGYRSVIDIYTSDRLKRTLYETDTGKIVKQQGVPRLKAELEGDFIGAAFESGVSAVQGRPTTTPFERVIEDAQESPDYYTGSAVGSAALWLTPLAITKVAKLLPGIRTASKVRPRFDYDPLYGSFADRESIRFNYRYPTRSESPEALKELGAFKPFTKPIFATPAALRTVEATEAARTREYQTRDGNFLQIEERPIEIPTGPVKYSEPVEVAKAAETARTTEVAKIKQTPYKFTTPLGIGGLTGAERKRKEPITEDYTIEVVQYPNLTDKQDNIIDLTNVLDETSKAITEPAKVQKPTLGQGGKSILKEQQDLISGLLTEPKQIQRTMSLTAQTTSLVQLTTQKSIFDIPTSRIPIPSRPTPEPVPFLRIPPFRLGGVPGGVKKSKSGVLGLTDIKKLGAKNLVIPSLSLTKRGQFVKLKKSKGKKRKKGIIDLDF